MPAHHLTPDATHGALDHRPAVTPDQVASGVLAVLAGTPHDVVANRLGLSTADLTDATETYHRGGQAALEAHASRAGWHQVNITFPDWVTAEDVAVAHLGPLTQQLIDTGLISRFWYIRKAPDFRVRLAPGLGVTPAHLTTTIAALLDDLATAGHIMSWRHAWYEPETAAFGGRTGMDIAHDLFSADSNNILNYLHDPNPVLDRRELSILLCTTLLRAAALEWFEIGDVWNRVTRLRPPPTDTNRQHATLAENLRTLLTCDPHPDGALFGADGPLAFAGAWAAAFHQAGHVLFAAATAGTLDRGIRDTFAYHVIFHWNRIGLTSTTQSRLAHAAESAILR